MSAEQLVLDGFESRVSNRMQRPWHTLNPVFFALQPPLAARARILALAGNFAIGLGPKARPQLNPHVSLLGLADLEDIPAGGLDAVIEAVSPARFEPFDVVFDRVQSFGRNGAGPLVLRAGAGEAQIVALGQLIRRALIVAGLLEPGKWTFTPHLTLLRGPPIEARAIRPIRWMVDSFALVHSERPAGRHNLLAHFEAR